MPPLTEAQISEYKEAFGLFDRDGDGCITASELGTVIRALGKSPTQAEINAIIKEVDPDSRGIINLPEFLSVMARDLKNYNSEQDLRNAWKVFDREGKGVLTAAELRHILSSIGEKLSKEELDDLMKEADPDAKGKVQYEEFVRMMTSK